MMLDSFSICSKLKKKKKVGFHPAFPLVWMTFLVKGIAWAKAKRYGSE